MEILNDTEHRIFLAAMTRERRVCEEVDKRGPIGPYEKTLISICDSIERKVNQAVSVRHGHWYCYDSVIGLYGCPLCDYKTLRANGNYCPNCGAKMDEVKTDV